MLATITLTEDEQALLLSCAKTNALIQGVRHEPWESIGSKIRLAQCSEEYWEKEPLVQPVPVAPGGILIDGQTHLGYLGKRCAHPGCGIPEMRHHPQSDHPWQAPVVKPAGHSDEFPG